MPTFKQGDYVQITSLSSIDSSLGLEVGEIYCIERDCPHEGGVMFVPNRRMSGLMQDLGAEEEDGMYILLYGQIQPVDAHYGEMFRCN